MANQSDNRDRRGRTPLHNAVINKQPDEVARLLKQGADPNVRDYHGRNGFTPLYYAATQTHDMRSVSALLAAKANLDENTKSEFMRQFDSQNTRIDKTRIAMRKTLGLY